jgi:hypothetical protein
MQAFHSSLFLKQEIFILLLLYHVPHKVDPLAFLAIYLFN